MGWNQDCYDDEYAACKDDGMSDEEADTNALFQ